MYRIGEYLRKVHFPNKIEVEALDQCLYLIVMKELNASICQLFQTLAPPL